MKLFALIFVVLCLGLTALPVIARQTAATQSAKLKVEILSDAGSGPKLRVTNHSDKNLTAAVVRSSISTDSKSTGHQVWDAIVQSGDPQRGGQQPLEPGASMALNLPRIVGRPLPDNAEVVAGVWADGESFGEERWLNAIFANRASMKSEYEQAIVFLQTGLEQKWDRSRYLAELNSKPSSGPFYAIRSTLNANPNVDRSSVVLERAMQNLVAHFEEKLALLRSAKPVKAEKAPV